MNDHNPAPLLLLHGFPLTAAMWRNTVAHFEKDRTVVAPEAADLVRGSLESPSMEAMAYAAREALDRAAPGAKAVVVGLSMGGYMAMEFARHFPDRVAALVLCDTRCAADTDEARANRDTMIESVRERGVVEGTAPLVGKLLSPAAPDSVAGEVRAMVEQGGPEVIIALVRALRDRRDHCAALESVPHPALVVRGADDILALPETSEAMVRHLPNARAVVIPNAGHVPPMEAPDAFNAALKEFLAANSL